MTFKKKAKLIVFFITGVSLFFGFIFMTEYNYDKMSIEEKQLLDKQVKAYIDSNTIDENYYKKKVTVSSNVTAVLKELPQATVLALVDSIPRTELEQLIKFIEIQPPESINFLKLLFGRLNELELKRLINVVNRIGNKRAQILIDWLLLLPLGTQKDLTEVIVRLQLSNIVRFINLLDQLDKKESVRLVEVMTRTRRNNDLFEAMYRVKENKLLPLLSRLLEVNSDILEKFIKITTRIDFITLDYLVDTVIKVDVKTTEDLMNELVKRSDREVNISTRVFANISDKHVIRANEMIQQDKRLFSKGVDYSERLEKHLTKKGAYDTVERSINTAARTNADTRYRGLTVMHEGVRDVAARRVFKQVDGQKDIYTDETIEKLVHDYENIDSQDQRDKMVNVVSGSAGVILGASQGQMSRFVTQERKLLRIQEAYSGNLQHKKDFKLEYMKRRPMMIPHTKEDTFIIKDPHELKPEEQL